MNLIKFIKTFPDEAYVSLATESQTTVKRGKEAIRRVMWLLWQNRSL